MRCTSCGTTNEPSAEKCEHCGASLSDASTHVSDAGDFDSAATVLGSVDAILVAVEGRQKYPLRPTSVIGRLSSCTIVVDNSSVSREHARLTKVLSGHLIEDLGSANGTLVNGERITSSVLLRPDDVVKIGSVEFRYELDEPSSPVWSTASPETTDSGNTPDTSLWTTSAGEPDDASSTLQAAAHSSTSASQEVVAEAAAPSSDASQTQMAATAPNRDSPEPVETSGAEPQQRSAPAEEGRGSESGASAAMSEALKGIGRLGELVHDMGRRQQEVETEARIVEASMRSLAPAADLQRHVIEVVGEARGFQVSTETARDLETVLATVVSHPRDIDALRALSDRAGDVAQALSDYRRLKEAVESLPAQ